ncbi:MAG: LD-carboxypeptidase [Caldimicrobium sp.]|nr:LD-carboxypeptidase [Caldimicrobium sp.]MCX7873896.1 LD-carboxypeptidase [Caldimicrobium sp.]MDW8094820.1 LD-carboxypeptidase [Caldimicrobium sp.]
MEGPPRIAIIRPSSIPDREQYEKGLAVLRENQISFKSFVDFEESPPSQKAFLLYEILTCGQFSHLWAVRGGAGAMLLLPFLEEFMEPKASKYLSLPQLIGFSDITALHLFFWTKFQKIGIHAPMIVNLPDLEKGCLRELLKILTRETKRITLTGRPYQQGSAQGFLVGGNLSLLASLCGTPYFPKRDSLVLFLEDVGERPYKLERALLQVLWSLPATSLRGIVFGSLGEVSAEEILTTLASLIPKDIPIAFDFPFGHQPMNYPLLIGAPCKLEVSKERAKLFIELEFSQSLSKVF